MLGFANGIAEVASTYGIAEPDEKFWRFSLCNHPTNQKESRIFDIFSFQTARYTTRTPCIDWFGAGQTFSAKEMRKAWKIVQVCFLHLCFYSSFLIAGKENPSCARGEVAGVTCGNLGNSSDLTLADGGDEAKGE